MRYERPRLERRAIGGLLASISAPVTGQCPDGYEWNEHDGVCNPIEG